MATCEYRGCDEEANNVTWRRGPWDFGEIPPEMDGRYFCDPECAFCWMWDNGIEFADYDIEL